MLQRREPLDRLIADALRGAVGRDERGMRGLQLLQPLDQPVVLKVADLRGRLNVVLPVVVADLLAEPGNFSGRIGRHGSISAAGRNRRMGLPSRSLEPRF